MTRLEAYEQARILVHAIAPLKNERGYDSSTLKPMERQIMEIRLAEWLLDGKVDENTDSSSE